MLNTFIATIASNFDWAGVINTIIAKGFRVVEQRKGARYIVVESEKSLSELVAVNGVEDAEKEGSITTPENDRYALHKKKHQ